MLPPTADGLPPTARSFDANHEKVPDFSSPKHPESMESIAGARSTIKSKFSARNPPPGPPPPGPRQARMGLLDLGRRHGHLAPPGGPRVVAPTPRWPATLGSKPGRSPEAGGPVGVAQGAAGAAQGRHFKIYHFFKFFYTKPRIWRTSFRFPNNSRLF